MWDYDFNTDFVLKPFEWLGFYAGGFVGGVSLGDVYHKGYSTFDRSPADVSFGGLNYGVNLGVDFSFGNYNQHSIEFYSKLNFHTIKAQETIQFKDRTSYATAHTYRNLPTIEAEFKRPISVGVRYVYHFVSSSYENRINAKRKEKARKAQAIADACPDFEREDLEKIKKGKKYYDSELEKGIVKVEGKTLYCTKIKVLSRTSKVIYEPSYENDYRTTIEETIIADKIKADKVIEKDVVILDHKVEIDENYEKALDLYDRGVEFWKEGKVEAQKWKNIESQNTIFNFHKAKGKPFFDKACEMGLGKACLVADANVYNGNVDLALFIPYCNAKNPNSVRDSIDCITTGVFLKYDSTNQ